MDAPAWDDGNEFVSAEINAESLGVGDIALGRGGQVAHHCAVFWRHFAQEFRADQAGGATHVLNDDVRVTLDVATDVPREYPGLDVGRAADVVVDEDRELLAGVVTLRAGCRRGGGKERQGGKACSRGHEMSGHRYHDNV